MKQIKRACSLLLTLALLCALTIPALAGTGFINGSTGTFVNHSGATFNNQGAFDNQGTVTNSGSFSNSGTLLDNGTWSGTVPSGKTSGAAITGLGANWVNSNNSFSFYAISFGKDNSFNETALKLEFKASTDSVVLTLYSTKDSTNDYWSSPSLNVVEQQTDWQNLVNSATKVTVSALDTSNSAGTAVLGTVAPITVPFAAQDIEQTLSFTAADTSADATTATILTSFGNTLQGGATGTITYSGSGVDQIESQSIIANYSASTSYDHTYTLSNSDMIAAAKNGTLSVYATASYGTATRDSSTKKLTLTYTTYTGSTTASAYGGGSGGSGGSSGYSVTFDTSMSPRLMLSLNTPNPNTSYNVTLSNNGGTGTWTMEDLPTGDDGSITFGAPHSAGTYNYATVYSSLDDNTPLWSGAMAAPLSVEEGETISTSGMSVTRRSDVLSGASYYSYILRGATFDSNHAYYLWLYDETGKTTYLSINDATRNVGTVTVGANVIANNVTSCKPVAESYTYNATSGYTVTQQKGDTNLTITEASSVTSIAAYALGIDSSAEGITTYLFAANGGRASYLLSSNNTENVEAGMLYILALDSATTDVENDYIATPIANSSYSSTEETIEALDITNGTIQGKYNYTLDTSAKIFDVTGSLGTGWEIALADLAQDDTVKLVYDPTNNRVFEVWLKTRAI